MANRNLVTLRPLDHTDIDNILSWVNAPTVVGNFASFSGKPFTRDDERAYIDKMTASETDKVYTVVANDDGRYLGQVGLHQIYWRSRVARLACIIGSHDEMGKGFGSAAIRSVLDIAFGELALHKVWLMIFSSNTRSFRTYKRIGFVQEGVLREEYFHEQGWHDMIRMSILAREFHNE